MINKAILISIKPEHVLDILNGTKTLELRKSVPKDYKGWVYIYCTKSKPYYEPRINGITNQKVWNIHNDFIYHTDLNSKVVARFWFDEYYKYHHDNHGVDLYTDVAEYNVMYDDLEKLCLDYREIEHYGKGKDLYAWHIKQLEIFDTPLSLSEFYKANLYASGKVIKQYEKRTNDFSYRLKRAPQSWQYVYIKE